VTPLVIDEIGVTSDREALGKLLTIADGDLPPAAAVSARQSHRSTGENSCPRIGQHAEAPCRGEESVWLGTAGGAAHCRAASSREARPGLVSRLPAKSGIDKEDFTLAPLDIPATSKFVRQRRHTRVRLRKTVRAVCTNLKESCSMEIKTASLTGGVATLSRHLTPGTQVQLRLQIGMRNLQATALMRDSARKTWPSRSWT